MKPSLSPRRRLSPLALAALLSLSTSCKDAKDEAPAQGEPAPADAKPEPPITPTPAPDPLPLIAPLTVDSAPIAEIGEVVMTAQLPTGTALQDLVPIIEKLAPGASTMVKMQLPTALQELAGMSLDGAKLDAAISIVAVNPSLHAQPVALLVKVGDLAKLEAEAKAKGQAVSERDGFALIGPPEVVAAAEAYAFANLTRAGDHTEIIVYPAQAIASLGPQLEQGLAMMDAQLAAANPSVQPVMRMYIDALVGVVGQTDRLVISVSAGQTTTDLQARAYPRAGSELASFVAAQVPSTHPLLPKLPSNPAQTVLMSGEVHGGAATPSLVAFMITVMDAMYDKALPAERWTESMGSWIESLDGQFAMSVNFSLPTDGAAGGMTVLGLTGATDATLMRKAWRDMIGALAKAQAGGKGVDMMGMKVDVEYAEDVFEHDGVGVDLYTTKIDPESLPEDQRAMIEAMGSAEQRINFTTFDQFGALATADQDSKSIRAMIDAARGKGPALEVSGKLAAALAISTDRGESLFSYFDVATLAAEADKVPFTAMVFGLGKQGDALGMRMSLQH